MVAVLDSSEQGVSPKVTVGQEDVLVGQIGSYVKVVQGSVSILAMLSRMAELEKLETVEQPSASKEVDFTPLAQRTIWLTPVGTINEIGQFDRGVSIYPTTGAEVHAVGRMTLRKCSLSSNPKVTTWVTCPQTRRSPFVWTQLHYLDDILPSLGRPELVNHGRSPHWYSVLLRSCLRRILLFWTSTENIAGKRMKRECAPRSKIVITAMSMPANLKCLIG